MSAPFVMLPIPVEVAKDVAIAHGYDRIVILAHRVADDEQPGGAHLTTFGRTDEHSNAAAHFGHMLRTEFFDWQPSHAFSRAAVDVLDERHRQVSAKDFDADHDDMATKGEIADAAACYALYRDGGGARNIVVRKFWPWSNRWWKPKDRRRNLVKAAALLLAEIERLDRAAKRDEVRS